MRKSRFTEEQIGQDPPRGRRGAHRAEVAKRHGVSDQTIYIWRRRLGVMRRPVRLGAEVGMVRATRETWAKRIEKWKASGRTAEEFASELGVRAKTLVWWGWCLGSKRAARSARGEKRALTVRARAESITPLTFIEMTRPPSDALEVVLRTDVRVRVPATFDPGALVRLLDVLEQRR